jgi:hypothetical protein
LSGLRGRLRWRQRPWTHQHVPLYYACRTRQVSGARGCPGHRVPADDLEAAVIDTLLNLYGDLNIFEDAIHGAYEDTENERSRLEDELASTEAQLRDTTASIDRYLRAFEAGTMPETICAPRSPSYLIAAAN